MAVKLKNCVCGQTPKLHHSIIFTHGMQQKAQYYTHVKCACGQKTKMIWRDDLITAKSDVAKIWNDMMKGNDNGQ